MQRINNHANYVGTTHIYCVATAGEIIVIVVSGTAIEVAGVDATE